MTGFERRPAKFGRETFRSEDSGRSSTMGRTETRRTPNALLAFGRRVSAGYAFDDLVAARGWGMETWKPTFVEECERDQLSQALERRPPWEGKQVLRPKPTEPVAGGKADAEARLLVASAEDLPTLYFVEWHYIDFVLSCLGNVSETARVLGIRRSTLQRKRKKSPPSK
jgi:hypothetical protein